jgi:hypothetical protein
MRSAKAPDVILAGARGARCTFDATAKECEGLARRCSAAARGRRRPRPGRGARGEARGLSASDKVEVLVSVAALGRTSRRSGRSATRNGTASCPSTCIRRLYFAKALAPSMMEKRNGGSITAPSAALRR